MTDKDESLSYTLHLPGGDKEQKIANLKDLYVITKDETDYKLYLLEKTVQKRIDWIAKLCHAGVMISLISAGLATCAFFKTFA